MSIIRKSFNVLIYLNNKVLLVFEFCGVDFGSIPVIFLLFFRTSVSTKYEITV
jgi:hypothetical protein